MPARLRVALWGGASLSNVGDQMLFDVTEHGLAQRLPGAEFARYCPWAADGGTVRPLWVGPSGRWPGTGSSDAIVIVGGVFAGPPFVNVLMQAFTLGAKPDLFDAGVAVAWHGVGLDDNTRPVVKPEWSAYLQALAGRLDLFTVRAPSAADRFRQAGAPAPGLVPDPSFARPVQAEPRPPARTRRPRIGVAVGEAITSSRLLDTFTDMRVVMRYVRRSGFDRSTCLDAVEIAGREFAEDELTPKRDFSRRLVAELAGLARLGTVEFIGVDNMYDDAAACAAFAAALGGAPVRTVRQASADALGAAFGGYDLVVVSRFHSVVLALQAGVPFIAADPYWHPGTATSKVHQLLASLGSTGRHWTGTPAGAGADGADGATLSDLAAAALAGGADDRDRYLAQHARAHDALDELAAVVSAAR
jgi:polysaccharide pyruvyl transferase WcaK-like protein